VRWLPSGAAARPDPEGVQASLVVRVGYDPLAVGLLTTMVLLTTFFALLPAPTGTKVVVFWAVQPVFDVMMCVVTRNIARSPGLPERMRRFWRALSFGGLAFAVGDSAQTVNALHAPGPEASVPGVIQTSCFVLGIGWIIWVMLHYPLATRAPRERARFWLDAFTVLLAAAVFTWAVTIPSGEVDGDVVVETLLTTALLSVAAFAAAKLVLSGDSPVTRAAATPVIVAMVLQGVSTALTPANLADGRWSHLFLAVRLLPSALIVFGPRVQELQVRADVRTVLRPPAKRVSALPYLMIAGTYLVLFVTLPPDVGVQTVGVLLGLVMISVLVVVRQVVAFADNAHLVRRLDASVHDLAASRRELARREEWFRSLVQYSSDVTTTVSADGTITYASPSVERILGYPPHRLIGRPLSDIVHADDVANLWPTWRHLVATPGALTSTQARFRHADGSWRWLEVISRNLLDEPGVRGIVGNAREVTKVRALHDELRYQASHDPLTGLANRALFNERLAAATGVGTSTAILLIDLDHFKAINDTLGHQAGDAVLVAVAHRLRACIRSGDTVARLGGDELAVLLPEADAATATDIARRFLDSLLEPVHVHGRVLQVGASVGSAAGAGTDPDELLRLADAAMYAAKRELKGRHPQTMP
jgi:diguanylate cyclase (GGDEF)-like protein/PAS domain S-box-containing protein